MSKRSLEIYQDLQIREIRVFMERDAQKILIAEYSYIGPSLQVGEILAIGSFKENPEYPNSVQILDISEYLDQEEGKSTPHVVISITAKPVL